MAPPFMKGWLQIITNEHKFKKFDADARWNKSKSKMLVVGVDVSDVDAVSTITGTAKKTMSNRKVVDLELNTWKLRFRESHKNVVKHNFHVASKIRFIRLNCLPG